jgi:hypothetical protein
MKRLAAPAAIRSAFAVRKIGGRFPPTPGFRAALF